MGDMPQKLSHISVLGAQAPLALVTDPNGIYVDATFGRGGHSRRILKMLGPGGRLIAFDRDEAAIEEAKTITDSRFSIVHSPFSSMAEELAARDVSQVSGILMDIGVSSPQIDDATRGFSFRNDGPLDMRMDQSCGMTAAQWLSVAKAKEIETVLRDYGEEKFAHRIAEAIVSQREQNPITRTGELAALIARVVPKNKHDFSQHPATRSFQGIRIYINRELDELKTALTQAGALIKPAGRLVVISFHSLEDRIVKTFFAQGAHPERTLDKRIILRASDMPQPLWQDVLRVKPDAEECELNPRARSAVMRLASRTEVAWDEEDAQ